MQPNVQFLRVQNRTKYGIISLTHGMTYAIMLPIMPTNPHLSLAWRMMIA